MKDIEYKRLKELFIRERSKLFQDEYDYLIEESFRNSSSSLKDIIDYLLEDSIIDEDDILFILNEYKSYSDLEEIKEIEDSIEYLEKRIDDFIKSLK
jgi:hypothetical protein